MNAFLHFVDHSPWFWPALLVAWFLVSLIVGLCFGRMTDVDRMHEGGD
jgi:hypothetical protein